MHRVIFLAGLCALALEGCSSKQTPAVQASPTHSPSTLSELSDFDTEVFPLPNGNAYLINNTDEALFLLSGGHAERVSGVDLKGVEATIYSLSTEGAYLVSSDGKGLRLYYLLGNKATAVQEGLIDSEAVQGKPRTMEHYLWAQYQAALIRQRRAKADAGEPPPERDSDEH